jgi:branched-chain amino acid transport system substrate-binding protein
MKKSNAKLLILLIIILPISSLLLNTDVAFIRQDSDNKINTEPYLSVIVGNYTVPGVSGPISLNEVLKIGILCDLNDFSGDHTWKGAILAAEEINKAGGVLINSTTYYIGLVAENTEEMDPYTPPSVGIDAAERMVNIHDPYFVMGGFNLDKLLAYQEVIMDAKIPFFCLGVSDDSLCENVLNFYARYKYFFRIMPLNTTSLSIELLSYTLYLVDYLNSTYGTSTMDIGILREELAWTPPISGVLETFLPVLNPNITIVNNIALPWTSTATDMTAALTSLDASGAQIVIPLFATHLGIMLSQEYLNIKPGYLLAGINTLSQIDTYWDQTAGSCRYGITMQSIENTSITPLTVPFWNNFIANYSHEPYYTGAGSYDAVRLLVNASIETQSFNPNAIVAQLEKINSSNPFPTVTGNIAFTPSHDLLEGWPFAASLFSQWQMDGNKVVLPTGNSIYPDSLATGTLSIPYWGIHNIVTSFSHKLPRDFVLDSDADDPDRNGAFNLNWTNSVGADNYSLYMSNETITYISEKHTLLAEQSAISPFPISGLKTGEYYFVAIAYNETGQKFSNNLHITVQLPIPGNFTLSTTANDPDEKGAFNLTWTDSDGADNYSIYIYNQFITEINNSINNLAYQTAISPFPVFGLLNGIYYYIAVAYNGSGQTMSNCIKVTVQRPPPGDFDLDSDADDPDTNGAFNLIWTDSVGADNYSVYTHNQNITDINVVGITNLAYQTAISPFPISGLIDGDYYYVVVAYNETGHTMAKCIHITVHLSGDETPDISGYNWIFLISSMFIISLIILFYKRSKLIK